MSDESTSKKPPDLSVGQQEKESVQLDKYAAQTLRSGKAASRKLRTSLLETDVLDRSVDSILASAKEQHQQVVSTYWLVSLI